MSKYADGEIMSDDGGEQGSAWVRGHLSDADAIWGVQAEHDCGLSARTRRVWAVWRLGAWTDDSGTDHAGGYYVQNKQTRGAFRLTIVEYVEEDEPASRCEHRRCAHGYRHAAQHRTRWHGWDNQRRADRLAMGAA